jgi:hypothetical protein
MMEVLSTSKTSANFCQIPRRNILEDGHLHVGCREKLKSNNAIRLNLEAETAHLLA